MAQKELLNSVEADSALIFIDFEAYATNPVYPNEIGAIRVQRGKLIASFHTFMMPRASEVSKIRGSRCEGTFYYTKKITGIVTPWEKKVVEC